MQRLEDDAEREKDEQGPPAWLLFLGSATYALIPASSGAWGLGRLGVVAVATLLPWLAHAALGFADPDPDRRWRAGWRTGLLLALATAFTPVAYAFALVLAGLVIGAAFWISPRAMRDRSVWGPPAATLATPVVLLLPWWLPLLSTGAATGPANVKPQQGGTPAQPVSVTTSPAGSTGQPAVAQRIPAGTFDDAIPGDLN